MPEIDESMFVEYGDRLVTNLLVIIHEQEARIDSLHNAIDILLEELMALRAGLAALDSAPVPTTRR